MLTIETERCVHCLDSFPREDMTEDHVPTRSWYPVATASNVQYLKVPSCKTCNNELSRIERDLLVRVGLCLDPRKEESSGLSPKALRTLGLDAAPDLSERERAFRERERKRVRGDLMPYAEVEATAIPGLGRSARRVPPGVEPHLALPIAYADLSYIAEKMARGFEYKRAGRYIEPPWGLRTFLSPPSKMRLDFAGEQQFDFGPGFKINYVCSPENPANVAYRILLWGTLCLKVLIGREEALRQLEPTFSKPAGLTRDDILGKRVFST